MVLVLAATALAGLSGYAIQLLAASALPGAESYLSFTVFWSMTFLFGAAVGGVQHEFARATHSRRDCSRAGSVHVFVLVATGAVAVLAVLIISLLGPPSFGAGTPALIAPFAVGAVGYLLTSVLTGLLYGLGRTPFVALLIAVDATFRGLLVVVGLAMGWSSVALGWGISAPFGLAAGIVWLAARRRIVGAYAIDVGMLRVVRNALHTVVAAAAMGLLVTGMPMLFRLSLADATTTFVASLTLAVTITRAPLIIPLITVQSFLVVRFRDADGGESRRFVAIVGAVAAVGVIGAAVAWFLGPVIVRWVSAGRYRIDPLSSAIVICSAALVAILCLTGPKLLAAHRHTAYAAGWAVAAIATVLILVWAPVDADARSLIAMTAAPALGVVVHAACMRRSPREHPVQTMDNVA